MLYWLAKSYGYHRWRMIWHIIRGHDIHGSPMNIKAWPDKAHGYRCTCGQGFGVHGL